MTTDCSLTILLRIDLCSIEHGNIVSDYFKPITYKICTNSQEQPTRTFLAKKGNNKLMKLKGKQLTSFNSRVKT